MDDLRPLVPRHFLSAPIWDVIETDTSRFAGEIDLAAVGPGDSRLGQIEANATDRDVALWVVSNGGAVWTNKADRMIRDERFLPSGDFRLVRIHLHDQTAQASFHGPYFPAINRIEFRREDIERLASLKELAYLEFSSARVTDDVLRRLSKLTTLERLILCGTRITDGGLSARGGMKRLNRLDSCNTAITDEGLLQIAKLKSLTSLDHLAEGADEVARLAASSRSLPQRHADERRGAVTAARESPTVPDFGFARLPRPAGHGNGSAASRPRDS